MLNFLYILILYRYFKAFLSFAGLNLLFAFIAGSLCAFFAPAAAGSGIPEVKAYLNGVDAPSILAPSTFFVKVIVLFNYMSVMIWTRTSICMFDFFFLLLLLF